jgi:hypothetical protein
VSPGAKELPLLSQLIVAVLRNEKLVAETWESSGTQKKVNVGVDSRYKATASEE